MPARRTMLTALGVTLAVVAVAVALGTSGGDGRPGGSGAEPGRFDPTTWMSEAWTTALGGDAIGPDSISAPVLPWGDDLAAADVAALEALAREVGLAELTGTPVAGLDAYFARNHPVVTEPGTPPSGATARHCRQAEIRQVAGARLPVGDTVKLAVIWRADCPFPPPSAGGGDAISFLYATRTGDLDPLADRWAGWVPVHPLAVPGAAAAARGSARVASSWELEELNGCSRPGVSVRGELVEAWAALCAEAAAAGVDLEAVTGWRSPADQQALWQEAVDRWGVDEARRRIAYSDGEVCLSRHCAGEAVDISPDPATLAWLQTPVGCLADGVFTTGDGSGCTGTVVVRAARYGFAATLASSPGHLDYLAGTTDIDADWYGDCSPGPVAPAELVRLVFTCRALEAGLPLEEAATVADQAETVARCTSALNPASVAHGGRYVQTPNPATGAVDDRAGLFGLSATVADNHVVGGAGSRNEAWANTDGAARLFVHERSWGRWGWDPFGCAAGDDGAGLTVLAPVGT